MNKHLRCSSLNRYTIFLAVYLLLALTIASTIGELRPVFVGHWFVQVPHTIDDYGIYILDIDGREDFKPAYLEKVIGQFDVWSFDAYGISQDLGDSIERGQSLRTEALFKKLQMMIFKKHRTNIEIHKRVLDPIVFVETGEVKESTPLGQYSVGPVSR